MARLVRLEPQSEGAPPVELHPGFTIGRGKDCHLLLDHESISRRHARIDRTLDGWRIVDLGSCNGTFVNYMPAAPSAELRDGDFLLLGRILFKFLVAIEGSPPSHGGSDPDGNSGFVAVYKPTLN